MCMALSRQWDKELRMTLRLDPYRPADYAPVSPGKPTFTT